MLGTVGLERYAELPADKLSHGDQRALKLGLALMTEPCVLLIEHNMSAVMRLAETVLVMVNGALIASGPPDQVRQDPAVRGAYLGAES